MKTTTLSILTVLILATVAQAGEDYSAKSGKAVIAPPPSCLWSWFAGGSVGYLTEFEEPMYTLHVGTERKCPDSQRSDAIFLEVGYTEKDDLYEFDEYTNGSFSIQPGYPGTKYLTDSSLKIIPITLNYKYEQAITESINWYAGAGAGIAFTDFDIGTLSFDDTGFYAHIFAGITYNVSEALELIFGARYIFMDDPVLTGVPAVDNTMSLDGDILIELGARYNF